MIQQSYVMIIIVTTQGEITLRRRLKREIIFSIYEKLRWIDYCIFDTWSLFKNFNNALALLKQLLQETILSNSSPLSMNSRRPENAKVFTLSAVYRTKRVLRSPLGKKIIHSLCVVRRNRSLLRLPGFLGTINIKTNAFSSSKYLGTISNENCDGLWFCLRKKPQINSVRVSCVHVRDVNSCSRFFVSIQRTLHR